MSTYNNLYVMKWLLENTGETNDNIPWKHKKTGGYIAIIHEGKSSVQIEVEKIQYRGKRIYMCVKYSSPGSGEIHVYDPEPVSMFTRKFASENDEELAEVMKQLFDAISLKVSQQELKDKNTEEERKQVIFHRLLFGNTQNE